MVSSPLAERPYAEETPPPPVAEAGTTMAATASGAARAPRTAPYFRCLRIEISLLGDEGFPAREALTEGSARSPDPSGRGASSKWRQASRAGPWTVG